ncbi:MAG: hypothetical protein IK016_07190 [Lachnospiraceae bacterium]|nr:hypothetical protein [Lachnospiraceae bacterium]
MIYGNVTTTDARLKTWDSYIEYKFNLLRHYTVGSFSPQEDGTLIGYHYGRLKYGEKYFVGKRHVLKLPYDEGVQDDYEYGVYKLVGSKSSLNVLVDTCHDYLIFEKENGDTFEVRAQSCILSKERIEKDQQQYGFTYPYCINKAWPDLEEAPETIPEQEYEFGIEPGVRSHIDTFIATVIYVVILLILKEAKGGSFSFNFGGAIAYYTWFIVGGIVLLGKFFLRKKR